MTSRPFDSESVVRLLEKDVVSTLGPRYLSVVYALAANVRRLALDWMEPDEDGERYSVEETQAIYDQKVVDDVQQYFHDVFVDTSWPACPRHPHHPLWFRSGAWWCEADGVALTRLGELPQQGAGPLSPSPGASPPPT